MDDLKSSPEIPLKGLMTKLIYRFVERSKIGVMSQRIQTQATAMLSNVPGPQEPVSFAGMEISDIRFYTCAAIPTYLGLMSFAGKVNCGIVSDAAISGEPKELAKHWIPALEDLEAAVKARDATPTSPLAFPTQKLYPTCYAIDRACTIGAVLAVAAAVGSYLYPYLS